MTDKKISTKTTQYAIQNGLLGLLVKEVYATISFQKPTKRRCKSFKSTQLIVREVELETIGTIDVYATVQEKNQGIDQLDLILLILKQCNFVITFKETRKESKSSRNVVLQVNSLNGINYKVDDLIELGQLLELKVRTSDSDPVFIDYSTLFSTN